MWWDVTTSYNRTSWRWSWVSIVPVYTMHPQRTLPSEMLASKQVEHTNLRAVPEIILRGGTSFFRPLHPQDKHGVRAPRPPGHVSVLINPPHYGSNMPWPPRTSYAHPPPLGHVVNKTPSPHRTKKCLRPPPEDNFWNSPKVFSISTLKWTLYCNRYRTYKGVQIKKENTRVPWFNTSVFIFYEHV